MTGNAIGQLGQHDRIICEARAVTAETPAHVHLLGDGDRHLADLAVALFAVQSGGDVRTVAEINKVRQDGNRHPCDGLVLLDVTDQLVNFRISDGDLLVAAPALGLGGKAGGGAAQRAWMAHQALDAQANMQVMRKLNGLRGRYLGLIDPPNHPHEQQHDKQDQTQLDQRLFQEVDDKFAHANSSYSRTLSIGQHPPEFASPNGICTLSL